jgi:hypothetical protein
MDKEPKPSLLAQVPAERPGEETEGDPETAEVVDAAPVRRKYWWVTQRPREACNAVATKHELQAMQRLFRKFDNGSNVADRLNIAEYVRKTPAVRLRRDDVFYPLRRPGVQERLDAALPTDMTFAEFLAIVYFRGTPRVLVELTLWASEAEIVPVVREVFAEKENEGPIGLETAMVILDATKGDVHGTVALADLEAWGVGDYNTAWSWISEYRTEQLLNFEESKTFAFKAQDLAEYCNHMRSRGKAG